MNWSVGVRQFTIIWRKAMEGKVAPLGSSPTFSNSVPRLKAVRTLRTAIDSIGLGRYYTNHSSELTTRRTKLVTVRLDW